MFRFDWRLRRGVCWRVAQFIAAAVSWVPPAHAGWAGLERVASGFVNPLGIAHAPGDPDRLFIATKPGTIRVLDLRTGVLAPTPFLTIPDADALAFESGLLGLAFHPNYQTNGKFYVHVNVDNGGGVVIGGQPSPFDTVIREYAVSEDPNVANPAPRQILRFPQPRAWHNGGWIGFSPRDGYLYAAIGEGGYTDALDPTANLLGTILRLDVDGDDFAEDDRNYAIPADNPFLDDPKLDEIWAYGLRNPWQASFDRATHDLWIGDVGQDTFEEINFQEAASPGGLHYGWPLREGFEPQPGPRGGPRPPGAVDPVYVFPHVADDSGEEFVSQSILGGYVYRGPDPTLRGTYVFGDSNSPRKFWSFDLADPAGTVANITAQLAPDVGAPALAAALGEDLVGNLYVAFVSSGEVYRLKTDALAPGDFNADGYVDGDDLAIWRAGVGATSGAQWSHGDADRDGDVDGADWLAWQRNVGVDPLAVGPPSIGGGEAVPEPPAEFLAAAATVAMLRRGRAD